MIRPVFLALICFFSFGCREQTHVTDEAEIPTVSPRAAVKLTLLVVDDPDLAKGIQLLSGEWSERSGGELAVETISLAEILSAETLTADVVIYPSRQLGALVSRQWLRPVRQSVLNDTDLDYSDLLPVLRDQCMRLGGEVWGVPLGEMPLVLGWHGVVPDNLPRTWEQLDDSPNVLRGSTNAENEFPLAAEFIARVVSATPPVDRATLFFEPESMDAQLDEPQMMRALEQIHIKDGEGQTSEESSCQVTLPPRDKLLADKLTPLLASVEMFNASLDRWEKTTSDAAPVILGFSGRLVSVTTSSRNAASAFKLLPWLVSGNTGGRLSQRSKATLWFRSSQVSQASKWLPAQSAEENAAWLTESLSKRDAYLAPRLPGIDNYLAALNDALASKSIPDALAHAETEWNAITDSQGREQQRKAFRQHLGLPD
ncbi:type 2 periplasmic-binding domain-containing protein [Bythopirellula goksoeyrii]|uniref:Bacterial extracellular solute-binding protein n=1 Tax=Bythopirellula goksoeyrii TaxID=1400387 RepID=A0A5B9QLK0_9BACT|nr:hypothetical protein [Bythopirellula goksoeyrii]QEG35011.1 hypothetical protein Pr1d_23010 [Bythopirellula goksoeyrii]